MNDSSSELMQQTNLPDIDLCIVRTRNGQRVPPELAALLDPVDAATFHEYRLPASTPVELHRHGIDEYWWFTSGRPVITLWTESCGTRRYQLEPGDMVACLRGVAHTLHANEELVYFQFSSVPRPGAHGGHLTDGVPQMDGQ